MSRLDRLQRHPQLTDGYESETTRAQADTERTISELFELADISNKPISLNRNVHLNWLIRLLIQGFPARYTSQDASQPWLLYFLLQSFQILGVAFDPETKKKAIRTILGKQHPDGGFGGGPGQFPHLLATYPAVCCLAIVGSPGPEGGWDQIDRPAMYKFFMSLKQPDGSFIVSRSGEVDVRGTFCLLAVATLLDLLTPELVEGTYDFLRSCQTYEGGFAASSQPYFSPNGASPLHDPRPYLGEAHGGYTSCAVASLMLLHPFAASSFPGVNAQSLLRWAVMMQGTEFDEGGAFRGRTNKLVDGCYSWWVGGLFPLVEELLGEATGESQEETKAAAPKPAPVPVPVVAPEDESGWADVDDSLFDKDALQRYIILAAQQSSGGLRDKPTTPADAYHTLYNLAGLSSAQHRVYVSRRRADEVRSKWIDSKKNATSDSKKEEGSESDADADGNEDSKFEAAERREAFVAALAWVEDEGASRFVGGLGNRVNATHPVFNLTISATRSVMNYFYGQNVV